MQKSFFRAKQPGPCRAQKKESDASDAWPAPAQKEGPAQALCLAGDIKRRSPPQTVVWTDSLRTAATYSPNWWVSTIGADELNFSVRDGKRWDLIALTTAICYLRDYNTQSTFPIHCFRKDFGLLVRVGFGIAAFTPPAYLRRSLQRPCKEVSS